MKSSETRDNIVAANAATNLLEEIECFSTIQIKKGRKFFDGTGKSTKCNKQLSSPDASENLQLQIDFCRSPLPKLLLEECIDLFERNMGLMYENSSWGLNLKEKKDEINHKDARFLIVTGPPCDETLKEFAQIDEQVASDKAAMTKDLNQQGETPDRRCLVAFAHFRFELDDEEFPTDEVLYLYEIQIDKDSQRCGVGHSLVSMMEAIAIKYEMKKVMLTVFKSNTLAMNFYLNKMDYIIDDCSPSNYEDGENEDYEILSKLCCS